MPTMSINRLGLDRHGKCGFYAACEALLISITKLCNNPFPFDFAACYSAFFCSGEQLKLTAARLLTRESL